MLSQRKDRNVGIVLKEETNKAGGSVTANVHSVHTTLWLSNSMGSGCIAPMGMCLHMAAAFIACCCALRGSSDPWAPAACCCEAL